MRLTVPVGLRFSDFDFYGHLNNVAMVRLLEEARIEAFSIVNESRPLTGIAAIEGAPGSTVISVVAHQEIEYLLPIPYQRMDLDFEVWVGRIGGSSIQICYEIFPQGADTPPEVLVRATSTLVMIDGGHKPVTIGEDGRAAWARYLEPPIMFSRR
jgi:acyl-CoA thioester hydrolase